jgi:hypothetical protein
LNLVDADYSLAQNVNVGLEDGVIGLYGGSGERIIVRGAEKNVLQRVTLVHELTHGLQDQHFELTYRWHEVHAGSALLTLIEGDAESVANAYLASLSDAEQVTYWELLDAFVATIDAAGDVFIPTLLSAPYTIGPHFVDALIAIEGVQAVHEALRAPPTSDEQILAPARFLSNETARYPALPRPRSGEQVLGRGTLGPKSPCSASSQRGSTSCRRWTRSWAGAATRTP